MRSQARETSGLLGPSQLNPTCRQVTGLCPQAWPMFCLGCFWLARLARQRDGVAALMEDGGIGAGELQQVGALSAQLNLHAAIRRLLPSA